MFLTKAHLTRRTALKGLGVTLTLPFLDAMLPAGTAYAKVADKKLRLIAIEMVHGAAGSTTFGARMNLWAPAVTGSAYDLSGTAMAALEPYRQHLTILGSSMGTRRELRTILELVTQKKLVPTVHRTLPLKDASEAHRILAGREQFGKVVLIP